MPDDRHVGFNHLSGVLQSNSASHLGERFFVACSLFYLSVLRYKGKSQITQSKAGARFNRKSPHLQVVLFGESLAKPVSAYLDKVAKINKFIEDVIKLST